MRMEKVLVFSLTEVPELKKILIENGFKIVGKNPDFIVTYGGDGTVLFCERKLPQVPKLIVKKSNVCRKCDYTLSELKNVLPKIREGKFRIRKEIKLETKINNEKLIGLNEIQIRSKTPIHALRFSLSVDGKDFSNLIGDGVVVATPFGSTAYYKSTGGIKFTKGIGLSFNNLHNKRIKSFVYPDNSIIKTKIHRGPAWVLADNYERFFELKEGNVSTIKKSESQANFIYVRRDR